MHSESYLLCSGYKIKPMENSKPERISGLGSSGFEFSHKFDFIEQQNVPTQMTTARSRGTAIFWFW